MIYKKSKPDIRNVWGYQKDNQKP